MKLRPSTVIIAIATAVFAGTFVLEGASTVNRLTNTEVTPRIAWYATLESGLAEAKRSNRPILFTSAAPQCLGVSGIW